MRRIVIVAALVAVMSLLEAGMALAGTTFRSQADLNADPAKYDSDTIYVAGYAQQVGTTYWHQGDGDDEDVASATYKVFQNSDLTGPYVFAVVIDRNNDDSGDNHPVPPLLPDGYLLLKGKWSRDNVIAAPGKTPGGTTWSLNVEGFDG
jgi:hypothetical protein